MGRGGATWLLGGAMALPKFFKFPLEYIKNWFGLSKNWYPAPPKLFQQFFLSSSLIQLQIKEKPWPTSSPTSQPQILNKTKIFSSKLSTLPAQPNPKSKIPNQTKQRHLPSSSFEKKREQSDCHDYTLVFFLLSSQFTPPIVSHLCLGNNLLTCLPWHRCLH